MKVSSITYQVLRIKQKIYHLSFVIYHSRPSRVGFTLIEILIVISIIGILSALLTTNFISVRQRSRDTQRKSDLRQVQSALELYRSDQGAYPATLPACGGAWTVSGTTYMKTIPCDPLGGSYTYTFTTPNYTVIACLENSSDAQKDSTNANPPCDGSTRFSYTLSNP